MDTFGQRLARLRTARGWTQKELAKRSGAPYMTIYRLEEGMYDDTRTATAAKLARTLGVSLDVLAGVYAEECPRRARVGALVEEAGLFAYSDAELAGIFAALATVPFRAFFIEAPEGLPTLVQNMTASVGGL